MSRTQSREQGRKASSVVKRYIGGAAIALLTALASVPLLAVLIAASTGWSSEQVERLGAALALYGPNTIFLLVGVASLSALIGVSSAWLVSANEFPGRRVLSWLLVLPLAAPAYIVSYLYTDLLEFAGPLQSALRASFDWGPGDYWFPTIRSLGGAILILSLVLYPYVYLLARASFAAQGQLQWAAARSLGKGPWGAFWTVSLPGARPAIAGGLALVMMETLADYGVADYFALPTFSTGIFRTWLAMGDKALALDLAGAMLAIVILLVLLEAAARRGQSVSRRLEGKRFTKPHLKGFSAFAAILVCSVPVLLGFVVPVGVLVHMTLTTGDQIGVSALTSYAVNSVSLGVIVAVLTTAVALCLAYTARLQRGPWVKGALRVATLGYALPGTLLAVGLLAPLAVVDQTLARAIRDLGWGPGSLLLTGTIIALTYALVIRFLTVSYNALGGGLAQISPSLEGAARSLGAGQGRVLTHIHLPLLRPSLVASLLLVFIDVLRELPATLILRPFNFETLATRVYRLASDERLAEASTAALIIVLMGLIPVILLDRLGRARRMQGVERG